MSPRRLQGWEPQVFTEYVYDDSGRLVGSVETREPEWDAEQVDLMFALDAFRHDIGPNGEFMSEATSEAADPTYYGPGAFRYEPHGPFTNFAEKARLDAIEAWKATAGESPNMNGMYWTVEKKTY